MLEEKMENMKVKKKLLELDKKIKNQNENEII